VHGLHIVADQQIFINERACLGLNPCSVSVALGKLLSFYREESHFSGTFSRFSETVKVLPFATVTRLTGSGRVGALWTPCCPLATSAL